MSYSDGSYDTDIQLLQGGNTLAVASGGIIGVDAGGLIDCSAGALKLPTKGVLNLDICGGFIITGNNIDTKANAAGYPASNTAPSLQRSNGATDKSLVLSWAASAVEEYQFATVPIPLDMDVTQPVTLKLLCNMGGSTDTPTFTAFAFEGVGGSTLGGATPALGPATGGQPNVVSLALTLTGYPNVLSVSITPGTHGTDAINLYAAWLEYTRKEMRVKLQTVMAGPAGIFHPGEHDFPDKQAHDLIAAGCAEAVEPARVNGTALERSHEERMLNCARGPRAGRQGHARQRQAVPGEQGLQDRRAQEVIVVSVQPRGKRWRSTWPRPKPRRHRARRRWSSRTARAGTSPTCARTRRRPTTTRPPTS